MPFDFKKIANENPLYDEDKFQIAIPKEYGQERQSAWDHVIAGRLADAMSTGHFLTHSTSGEGNPTLAWAKNDPKKVVGGLIATDLAMLPVAKLLEKKHPKLTRALLTGLGGMGTGLAMKNLVHERNRQNFSNEEYFSNANRANEIRMRKK